jgi:hypothetical protein
MMGRRHHIEQIADLAVAAMHPPVDHQLQWTVSELALQSPDYCNRGVIRVAYSEYNLEFRVILFAKGPQAIVSFQFGAAQGFEYGYGRPLCGRGLRERNGPAYHKGCDQAVTHRGDGEQVSANLEC